MPPPGRRSGHKPRDGRASHSGGAARAPGDKACKHKGRTAAQKAAAREQSAPPPSCRGPKAKGKPTIIQSRGQKRAFKVHGTYSVPQGPAPERKPGAFTLGTDFSGLETPSRALVDVGLGDSSR